jgi:hypothetical protein
VPATFTDIAKTHYVLLPEPLRHAFSGIRDAPDATADHQRGGRVACLVAPVLG